MVDLLHMLLCVVDPLYVLSIFTALTLNNFCGKFCISYYFLLWGFLILADVGQCSTHTCTQYMYEYYIYEYIVLVYVVY